MSVLRHLTRLACGLLLGCMLLPAATLRQMSVDEMAQAATSIVRAKVVSSAATLSGKTIYTHYQLQVSETLKGQTLTRADLPGGETGGIRQSFPGVPQLRTGTEYVIFLWTSSTGVNHIIGLSQGLFTVASQADGSVQISRPQIGETMHDAQGNAVRDHAVTMAITDLRARISRLASQGAQQ